MAPRPASAVWTRGHSTRPASTEVVQTETVWNRKQKMFGPRAACPGGRSGEFRELAGVRAGRTYICLPTLDAMAPRVADLCRAVETVAKWDGPVCIHCALGHGRTGTFAAAVLVARGLAADIPAALTMLRAVRPGIRLNSTQKRCLEALRATTDP